jgi:copper chaperone CopZ
VRATYEVPDVHCQNCVRHITDELMTIPGVQGVIVDLAGKTVTVDHDGAVTDSQIRAGIDEAGYEVAGETGR